MCVLRTETQERFLNAFLSEPVFPLALLPSAPGLPGVQPGSLSDDGGHALDLDGGALAGDTMHERSLSRPPTACAMHDLLLRQRKFWALRTLALPSFRAVQRLRNDGQEVGRGRLACLYFVYCLTTATRSRWDSGRAFTNPKRSGDVLGRFSGGPQRASALYLDFRALRAFANPHASKVRKFLRGSV